ncbi:hypothetical protein QMK30_09835 [Streptomyces sp. H27-C3]|nr:hypothetical protein [Streptomyces sp. H27-C3]
MRHYRAAEPSRLGAGAWLAAPDENTPRLVRHALRSLIKQGNPGALALMGFVADPALDIGGPVLAEGVVPYGGTLHFTASVTNTAAQPVRLAIDYVVHHLRANGQQSTKTFKLVTKVLGADETLDISREHSFREITTRRYYPGEHAVELQINGTRHGHVTFDLQPPGAMTA